MVKILKEQAIELENLKQRLIERRKLISNEFSKGEVINGDYTAFVQNTDYDDYAELLSVLKEIEEIDTKIKTARVIKANKGDIIDIGSAVKVKISGRDNLFDFVLVEERTGLSQNHISINSPLGKSVVGKMAGDEFNYHVDASNIDVSGKIVKVGYQKVKKNK